MQWKVKGSTDTDINNLSYSQLEVKEVEKGRKDFILHLQHEGMSF
jgi:hypothetical protein